MSTVARTDTSLVGHWWWTVDKWILGVVLVIAGLGAVLTLAASPAVAERIGLDTFHFAQRQFVFLALALVMMFMFSLLAPIGVLRLSMVLFAAALILTAATLFLGAEIKGSTRWLQMGGFSLQPSEFLKPTFAVVAAWFFAQRRLQELFSGYAVATGLFAVVVGLLLLQPDVGMTIVVAAVWSVQFFLAGLPLILVAAVAILFLGGGISTYFMFDHVRLRVDRFIDPAAGEGYQVSRAMEAFRNGGLFGMGPGEGQVKEYLPDAHADFILAVAGEEFGLIACLIVVALFAFVVLRGFARVFRENDLFVLLAGAGLLVQFGLQAVINMASTVHLMPPKGMTLPFISYGGSSTLALALGMGMVLALTRRRPEQGILS
jgi:cell division protein FtsW